MSFDQLFSSLMFNICMSWMCYYVAFMTLLRLLYTIAIPPMMDAKEQKTKRKNDEIEAE